MKSKARTGFYNLLQMFVSRLPVEFSPLKRGFYNAFGSHISDSVLISDGAWIDSPEFLIAKDHTWIDRDVMLVCGPAHKPGRKEIRKPLESLDGPGEGQLIIGKRVHVAPQAVIQAHGGVAIGDESGIASGVKIYSISHHYRNLSDPSDEKRYRFTPRALPEDQIVIVSPVVLEDNTGIGLNCVILPGTRIRSGSWVAAGAVVRGDYEGDSIIGGNPATVIKKIGGKKPENRNSQ